MDSQRARKKGRPNMWLVITLTKPEIRANLRKVQLHLEEKYKMARSSLRQGFTDFDSNEVHVTLLGLCSQNQQRTDQVVRILSTFPDHLKSQGRELSFELELKGLGSWFTRSERIILYSDFTKDTSSHIKILAKEIRDYLKQQIDQEDPKETQNLSSDSDLTEEDKKEPVLESSWSFSQDDEESDDANYTGLWFDDPHPDIYVPHLTILNSDPKHDKLFRKQLLENHPKSGKRGDKRNKRGGSGKGGTDKGNYERDPFGRDYSLFRDIKKEFSKTHFGTEMVLKLELQKEFKCILEIPLTSSNTENNKA